MDTVPEILDVARPKKLYWYSKRKCGAYGIFRLTALDFLYVRLLMFFIVTNYSPFLSISSVPSGRFVNKRYFLTKRVVASIYFT